jgi:hypothetical protein
MPAPHDARLGSDATWKPPTFLKDPVHRLVPSGRASFKWPIVRNGETTPISVTWRFTSERVRDRTFNRVIQGREDGLSTFEHFLKIFMGLQKCCGFLPSQCAGRHSALVVLPLQYGVPEPDRVFEVRAERLRGRSSWDGNRPETKAPR